MFTVWHLHNSHLGPFPTSNGRRHSPPRRGSCTTGRRVKPHGISGRRCVRRSWPLRPRTRVASPPLNSRLSSSGSRSTPSGGRRKSSANSSTCAPSRPVRTVSPGAHPQPWRWGARLSQRAPGLLDPGVQQGRFRHRRIRRSARVGGIRRRHSKSCIQVSLQATSSVSVSNATVRHNPCPHAVPRGRHSIHTGVRGPPAMASYRLTSHRSRCASPLSTDRTRVCVPPVQVISPRVCP